MLEMSNEVRDALETAQEALTIVCIDRIRNKESMAFLYVIMGKIRKVLGKKDYDYSGDFLK